MSRALAGLILLVFPCLGQTEPSSRETVILLHGIVNRPFVMIPLQKKLEKEGFQVLNWGYASTEKTIEEYAADLHDFVKSRQLNGPVHFVGFSLGSIIARYYLSTTPPPRAGRFVQIAPPNHGSPQVERFEKADPFRWVYGDKAIQQLKSDSEFLKKLGTPSIPFGIIAGGRGTEGFSSLIPGDDDGSVPWDSARLDGAADRIRVSRQHTLLLASGEVHRNVVVFLRQGRFASTANRREKRPS